MSTAILFALVSNVTGLQGNTDVSSSPCTLPLYHPPALNHSAQSQFWDTLFSFELAELDNSDSTMTNKETSSELKCCGQSWSYNPLTHLCCAHSNSSKIVVPLSTLTQIRLRTGLIAVSELKCSCQTSPQILADQSIFGCCNDRLFDRRLSVCCDDSLVSIPSMSQSTFMGQWRCCGQSVFDSTTETCCNEQIVHIVGPTPEVGQKRQVQCCGQQAYYLRTLSVCCNRTVVNSAQAQVHDVCDTKTLNNEGVSEGTILVFHWLSERIEEFNVKHPNQSRMHPQKWRRSRANAAALYRDGLVYLIGGYHSVLFPSSTNVDIYDIHSRSWSTGPKLRVPRRTQSAVVLKNILIVCGCASSGRCERTCEYLRPTLSHWRLMVNGACAGGAAQASVTDQESIIISGAYSSECRNATSVFNLQSLEWTMSSDLPGGRYSHGAALLHSQMYICGGMHDTQSTRDMATAECVVFHLNNQSWTSIATMNVPRVNFKLLALDNHLLAFGGEQHKEGDSVEVYSVQLNSWTLLPQQLRFNTQDAAVVLVN